jgi:GMP synthase (glutamine-hydrolysing)
MIPLLILKTGSAPDPIRELHGDFDRWFIQSLGPDRFDYQVVAVDEGATLPPNPAEYAGIVVTGSPAMVSHRLDWSEAAAAWLARAHRCAVPLLGVCYGHQLLAHALGGRVGPNPHGRRMGTHPLEIQIADDALLGDLPAAGPVHVTHEEAVLDLPPAARVVARADGDPHHAIHFGQRSWGVQFHPEFDAEIMACYIQLRADKLRHEGQDPDRLLARIETAPAGPALMRGFASLVEHTVHSEKMA